jgi:hypothetical protein
MKNQSIDFKREREFGDLFNDTFNFIIQEFKRLGTPILYYVLPLLIFSAIGMTIYSVKIQAVTQTMAQSAGSNPFVAFEAMGQMMGIVTLVFFLSIISTVLLMSTVLCYIKLYINEGTEGFTTNDVWKEVMKNFWTILLSVLVVGVVVVAGFACCVIPGVYLSVVLSLIFPIIIFEGKSFSDSFSRSFKLIKNNWWFIFGVLIVIGIIYYILAILVTLPNMLMGFNTLFTNIKKGATNMDFSVGFYIINSISQLLTQLFSVIIIVMSAFIYYSLVEKMEHTSLMDKIEQMTEDE